MIFCNKNSFYGYLNISCRTEIKYHDVFSSLFLRSSVCLLSKAITELTVARRTDRPRTSRNTSFSLNEKTHLLRWSYWYLFNPNLKEVCCHIIPCLPGAPRWPCGPCSPTPTGPIGPGSPLGPIAPSCPTPGSPWSPASPRSPLGPPAPGGPGMPGRPTLG